MPEMEVKSIAPSPLASLDMDNETPRRKRKRETKAAVAAAAAAAAAAAGTVQAAGFTNAAFSSTPKKLIGRRRLARENANPNAEPDPFGLSLGTTNACLEVKSIAALAQEKQPALNPFEVLRQPSKKKKREHACFENPGLNLEIPEKQFNPYEVVRTAATPSKCFINEALNLRGNDLPASLNPFEIPRQGEVAGVENPTLSDADAQPPTSLKIGLPFAPTVGCRIDFKGLSLAQLTPSKLLAEKLVFSPVPGPKRSLGAISEESTFDIGRELDCYQLELENSINEAKLRKNGHAQLIVEQKKDFEIKFDTPGKHIGVEVKQSVVATITEEEEEPEAQTEAAIDSNPIEPKAEKVENDEPEADVVYASESEEEEEEVEENFKAPSRFVRSYRPAAAAPAATTSSRERLQAISKESLQSTNSSEGKSGHGVKSLIRNSIRRLMHPKQSEKEVQEKDKDKPQSHHNIMSSIRHSLRRRPQKVSEAVEESSALADISIVDSSERTLKLRSFAPQTEYMRIEQLTNERKHTLRNSIRRSTRDVLHHVFHKSQDAYATAK